MNALNQRFVAGVVAMVADILKRSSARLAGVGLTPSSQPPRETVDDCEFSVEFVSIGGVADVLEFHIVRRGRS